MMQENNSIASLDINRNDASSVLAPVEDYSTLLNFYAADYTQEGFYWQVGRPVKTQGWILHLSVIVTQLPDLLHQILPLLIAKKVPFKIALNKTVARWLLDGNLDYKNLGKVITIYPDNDFEALTLAKILITLTQSYEGTFIPTDITLGGIIHTCYGAFNPICRPGVNGQVDKYIYDINGTLIRETYPMPFQLPYGINWPFTDLASAKPPNSKTNLQTIYKALSILKPDARGNVMKGIYLKGFLKVGSCVIKIGKKNMLADDLGRTIRDRLIWQRDLHKELADIVPLPRILDLFEEHGDMYLVMEFIKGKSLFDRVAEINLGHKSWFQIPISERTLLLDWLLKIISIIGLFHEKGFVHRDIAPGNFIITPDNQIVLIDTELAYDLNDDSDIPPFELGTPGFMSPEQELISKPTIKEDIYGFGALMINVFTGLSPLKFCVKDPRRLADNLAYFIPHRGIIDLITSCMDYSPTARPDKFFICTQLKHYYHELATAISQIHTPYLIDQSNASCLKVIIQEALEGLNRRPMPISSDGIWLSKTQKTDNPMNAAQKDYSPYAGMHTGLSGVLYLLSKAKKSGFDLESNKKPYRRSWRFLQQEYIEKQFNLTPGLYSGLAGIGLSLIEGIASGLLEDTEKNRLYISKCLDTPTDILGVAEGVSGQGIVLIQAAFYMRKDHNSLLLNRCVDKILQAQRKDGSWNVISENSKKEYKMPVGFAHGVSGILWFLLEYNSIFPSSQTQKAISKGLECLLKKTNNLKSLFDRKAFQKMLGDIQETGDERTGILLCFMKAYVTIQNTYYKELVEKALSQYPDFVINNNLSLDGGISQLGEVYLEAAKAFKNQEWKRRAIRIAEVLVHIAYRDNEGSCYWLIDETKKPSADLMVGNSGIIHFLLRCQFPHKIGYPLLN